MISNKNELTEKIVLNDITRSSATVRSDFSSWINAGVNAGVNGVANDGSEFPPSSIDQLAIDHRTMIRAIVTEIGRDCASAKIDFFANDRVANIR